MALTLVVQKKSISSDCGTLTIEDATGSYDVTDNPGGYGAPNETRANLYLKLIVTLKKTTGDETITVDAYDENTVTEWAITITEDGRYESFLFACLAWGSGITYELNYITYDASTDKYYKSLQNSNLNNAVTDPLWWEETEDIDDFIAAIDASQPDIYSDTENIIELCNSVVCKNRALTSVACCCNDECTLQSYEKLRMLLEAAQIRDAQGSYNQAQEIIERIQTVCEDIDCETNTGCGNC